jgi:Ankyrin repeats (3 copies)
MLKRYWPVPVFECVVAICVVGFLWHGGRIVDAVAGLPGPDQQLIVACYAPDNGFNFDEALADGASVSARDRDGATALMLSAGLGQFDHVRRLLEKGADINATDNYGRTPLMYAAIAGRLDMTGFLINYGADIQRKDSFGMTAAGLLKVYHQETDLSGTYSSGRSYACGN